MLMPRNSDQLLVCCRSPSLYITNMQGQIVKSFSSGKKEGGDFVCATASSHGQFLYAISEDSTLYCFNIANGNLEHSMKVHDKEPLGIIQHPHRNLTATFSDEGSLKLWK